MHILLVNHYAGAPHLGMEYRPYYMAREWVKAGHKVWIVAADVSHLRQQSVAPGIQVIDGITYRWLPTFSYCGNGIKRVINIFSFCRNLRKISDWVNKDVRPDVIIASSTYPMDIWPCRYLARQSAARLIWEVHDLWPLSPIELGGMSRWHPFILLVQRAEDAACRISDSVVSLLPAAERHLVSRGMDHKKFHYIPNGVNPDEWVNHGEQIPDTHRRLLATLKGQGRWILGYAGSHGVSNALGTVIDAFSILRDTRASLVLLGQGPEKEGLIRRALSNGGDVHFLPSIPKQSVPAFLRSCDALYIGWQKKMIYQFGISPNKIMDYAMAAKPIIHSTDAPNDLVADSKCGISVPPENHVAVADAVRHLITLPPHESVRMGKSGHDYVLAHYNYRVLAQAFISVM